MDFSELNIQRLFGQEAAEGEEIDRLKEYYFKSKIYSKVIVDRGSYFRVNLRLDVYFISRTLALHTKIV